MKNVASVRVINTKNQSFSQMTQKAQINFIVF